ncbi:6-hydroxymethylpterin diphosphokinase MptE-like protein [Paraglaciecola sp. 20A4]|uniref:6-hydroxymethylpterin diphosphokinase MptE-like protein n=1 Tax=Paraglaciecola sp. 20A4 TaxID=2687288 RepID=UPI001407D70E|nr:6-hydroxymethylpterin diphosphokinase MptE-like protein [Paraglaciecola sp. 20A4]
MLKNIRLHLEKDEEKQASLDDILAKKIVETRRNNINAFQRNIPSLLPYITESKLSNLSLFNNKYGETNIVDYGVGRTLYGFHPQQEIEQQVFQALRRSPRINLIHPNGHVIQTESPTDPFDFTQLKTFKVEHAQSPMPEEIDCLVILGCGLGLHIKRLLEERTIKNLIIYEPEIQYFQCSTMAISWSDIFALAKEKGTALFLQIEKDGRDLISDVTELKEHSEITHFHIYKHYNHQVFDSVYRDVCERSWKDICNSGFTISPVKNHLEYIPNWTPKVDLSTQSAVSIQDSLFKQNLAAFEKYFPNIYAQYKDYKPKIWLPIKSQSTEINVLKAECLNTWYGDSPKQDCFLNFDNFNEQPNKDGLILGYTGKKLAHYIHYQFVNETQKLLEEAKEEVGALPDKVPSIIMFGLGVGYQLEKLLIEHTVEKIFICEPNPDFFYASLFALDWQNIFETIKESESRIYLNIGDDGTNLFRDLLRQFYAIGPYILNSTYFYQSYYNASLNSAISQLREQLQIVISMGEYFDHAYYGIAHTKESMKRKIPVLAANPTSKLSYDDKEVPIFIVGNGPSLDSSIEAIKEWQGQAIVVSCGTALQALHIHGITPDFHAEIEQNRSTFDWAVLIGDLDYLKNITLISCNGIHPDTCDLYKDVLIAFKEGESSTISALNVLGRENFTTLLNAFPTVSNFAIDLFSTIGFTNIYLLGVDLGFVDVKHHHSKSSGYYLKNGQETYDYAEKNNTSLIVPGNFRPTVNTKHEFKVSRQVIEQVTSSKPKDQTFYNCSDGAKIKGTLPIRTDNLLIVSTVEQKQQLLKQLKTVVFSTDSLANFTNKFDKHYSQELLIKELEALESLLVVELKTTEDVNRLINSQKEMLFTSYKNGRSLLFYYLYGTVNYANALLSKLQNTPQHSKSVPKAFIQTKEKWLETIGNIKFLMKDNEEEDFDVSSFNIIKRESKKLENHCGNCSILIATDSSIFTKSLKFILDSEFSWINKIDFLSTQQLDSYKKTPDYAIYHLEDLKNASVLGKINTIITLKSDEASPLDYNGITYLKSPAIKSEKIFDSPLFLARVAILSCLSEQKCNLILPKYRALQNIDLEEHVFNIPAERYIAFDNSCYISVFLRGNFKQSKKVLNNGTRTKKITGSLKIRQLIFQLMTEIDFSTHKQKVLDLLDSKI